jgi:hypothetical protein
MIDSDVYLSFKELILQGRFQNKHGQLEDTLRVLERAGWLTGEQRKHLQVIALYGAPRDAALLARGSVSQHL